MLRFLIVLLLTTRVFSQDRLDIIRDSILAEGYFLFSLERASWIGTDLARELVSSRFPTIKGYLSYPDNDLVSCIFWTRDDTLVSFKASFDSTFDINSCIVDTVLRPPSLIELKLIRMRENALNLINADTSGFFKMYHNTTLNLIPIAFSNDHRVVVITGATVSGFMPIGNDYIMWYDSIGTFLSQERLHYSLIAKPLEPKPGKDGESVFATYHSHTIQDFITSTDVCTILLYQNDATWSQHYVVGKSFVSLWNKNTSDFIILTKDAFLNMGKK